MGNWEDGVVIFQEGKVMRGTGVGGERRNSVTDHDA
jgi:hypothetical protein